MKDGQIHPRQSFTCIVNVCVAATFEAQPDSAICAAASPSCVIAPFLDFKLSRMASRRGPSQALEDDRIAKERWSKARARLQAIAKRSRVNIAEQKREREEAAHVAEASMAARNTAKTPTPAPPRKAPATP